MHSSWFRKPVYKRVRWLAVFFIAGSLAYAYSSQVGWFYVFFFVLLWLAFSMICSFNIQSGAYVTTINKGRSEDRNIYLTFDDGPVKNTSEIIEILDRYQAKATFFITGEKAMKNRKVVKNISDMGHCIGNHSFTHKSWFPLFPVRKIREELKKTQFVLEQITGDAPHFFRPPFGVTNPLIASAIKSFDFTVIGWSLRSLDTITKSVDKVTTRIKKRLKPGCIVLLHDTSPNIGIILETVLKTCDDSGLKPVSLNELKF
jgi:peptidoglycan/xylan/chitin deacetylase (PgdA/CDA1 family)